MHCFALRLKQHTCSIFPMITKERLRQIEAASLPFWDLRSLKVDLPFVHSSPFFLPCSLLTLKVFHSESSGGMAFIDFGGC